MIAFAGDAPALKVPAYHVRNFGSVMIVQPENAATRELLASIVDPSAMWWCGGLVVEPRYLEGLLEILNNPDRED